MAFWLDAGCVFLSTTSMFSVFCQIHQIDHDITLPSAFVESHAIVHLISCLFSRSTGWNGALDGVKMDLESRPCLHFSCCASILHKS